MANKKIENMSYRELQKEAKKLGLSVKEKKDDLKKTITSYKNDMKKVSEEPQRTLPNYENARVLEILIENHHEGFHRCKMSDETVKDVPVKLF
jgi:ectoine hydroxylase-related dioxygenase (phytanoyl-CoA dioxygenase family)